jgi:hypothetical protein
MVLEEWADWQYIDFLNGEFAMLPNGAVVSYSGNTPLGGKTHLKTEIFQPVRKGDFSSDDELSGWAMDKIYENTRRWGRPKYSNEELLNIDAGAAELRLCLE